MRASSILLACVATSACFDKSSPVDSGGSEGSTAGTTAEGSSGSASVGSVDGTAEGEASASSATTTASDTSASTTAPGGGCGDGVVELGQPCLGPMPAWAVMTDFTMPEDVRFARFDRDAGLDGVASQHGGNLVNLVPWTWTGEGEP